MARCQRNSKGAYSAKSEFQAIRHYPDGREVLVRLRYAGGDRDRIALAPVDRLTIQESDSGAMVEFDGKPVGIVQSVDTGTDRVNVLRFDRIDDLVGERFRSAGGGRSVDYAGVWFHGQQQQNWTAYVQAWLSERAKFAVFPANSKAGTPSSRCEVRVDVIAWDRATLPIPSTTRRRRC